MRGIIELPGGECTQLDAAGVVEDACHHLVGQLQGAAPGSAHRRRAALRVRTDSAKARNSACSGSSDVGDQLLESDSGLRASRPDANAQRILAREIERDVFVLLEETHLADAFGGDAAGGDVGDGARGKFDARVGDVDFIGDHRNADGFEIDDRRIDEREQDIEVVDHHVVDDVDIEAARRENAEPMDFEKHGPRNDALGGRDRRIESLDVADLQNPRRALCRSDQLVGFLDRRCHRLFDEHVDPGIEQAAADARVFLRGHGEADGLDARGGECIKIGNHPRAEFRGDLRARSASASTMPASSTPSISRHTRT